MGHRAYSSVFYIMCQGSEKGLLLISRRDLPSSSFSSAVEFWHSGVSKSLFITIQK